MGVCISREEDGRDEDYDEDTVGPLTRKSSGKSNSSRSTSSARTASYFTKKEMAKTPEFDEGLAKLHSALAQQWVSSDQIFEHLDSNKTGTIEKADFEQWLTELKLNGWWTKYGETIWQIMVLDDDGKGTISAAQLRKFLKRAQVAQQQSLSKEVKAAGQEEIEVTDETRFVVIIGESSTLGVIEQFVADHLDFFVTCPLATTAGTAAMLEKSGMKIAKKVHSASIGGHQEIGDLVCTKRVAAVIFFRDPLSAKAYHSDTEALVRVCDVHQIPVATNPGTAKGVFMFLKELGLQYREAQNEDSVLAKYKRGQAKVVASVKPAGSKADDPGSEAKTEATDTTKPAANSGSGGPSKTLKRAKTTVEEDITLNDGLVTLYRSLSGKWISVKGLFTHLDPQNTGTISQDMFEGWMQENDLGEWWDMFGPFVWSIFDEEGQGYIDVQHFTQGMARAEQAHYQTMQAEALKLHKPGVQNLINNETRFVSLVAHNEMKPSMMKFVEDNFEFFCTCPLVTTGTTGKSLEKMGLKVGKKVNSGPVGGDQEVAAMGCNGRIAAVFFFKDPLSAHPHAADIEALVRVCDVHGIPYATNPGTARGVLKALKVLGLQWREKVSFDLKGVTAFA